MKAGLADRAVGGQVVWSGCGEEKGKGDAEGLEGVR